MFSGPAWVDYLTVEFNKSEVMTYNLAYGKSFFAPVAVL